MEQWKIDRLLEISPDIFKTNDDRWLEYADELEQYYKENAKFPSQKYTLGIWLVTQRTSYKKGTLEQWKIDRLLEISPDIFKSKKEIKDERWMEKANQVKQLYKENGSFPEEGEPLGDWFAEQEREFIKGNLEEWKVNFLLEESEESIENNELTNEEKENSEEWY